MPYIKGQSNLPRRFKPENNPRFRDEVFAPFGHTLADVNRLYPLQSPEISERIAARTSTQSTPEAREASIAKKMKALTEKYKALNRKREEKLIVNDYKARALRLNGVRLVQNPDGTETFAGFAGSTLTPEKIERAKHILKASSLDQIRNYVPENRLNDFNVANPNATPERIALEKKMLGQKPRYIDKTRNPFLESMLRQKVESTPENYYRDQRELNDLPIDVEEDDSDLMTGAAAGAGSATNKAGAGRTANPDFLRSFEKANLKKALDTKVIPVPETEQDKPTGSQKSLLETLYEPILDELNAREDLSRETRNALIDTLRTELKEKLKATGFEPLGKVKTRQKQYIKPLKDVGLSENATAQYGSPWAEQVLKGLVEQQMDTANKAYESYPGQRVAARSPMEETGLELMTENSPFSSPEYIGSKKEIKERIKGLSKMPKPSEVSRHHFDELARNPHHIFREEFDKEEREKWNQIENEADRRFGRDVVPILERVNQIGPARYGAVGESIKQARREHDEALHDLRHKLRHEINEQRRAAGHSYMQNQMNSAEMKSKQAALERDQEANAATMLQQHHQQVNEDKKAHASAALREGAVDRALEQQNLNTIYDEYQRAKEHPFEQGLRTAAIVNKMPLAPNTLQMSSSIAAPRNEPNSEQQLGAGLFNAGLGGLRRNQLPRKKGGIIRHYKADGGLIREAVQNAVIDNEDPLHELRRLMNRQRMMDVAETKIGKRRKFQVGGMITSSNPIAEGAEQAREFKARDKLTSHLENLERPEPESPINDFAHDFMTGVASVGGTGFLGGTSRAYLSSEDRRQKQKAARDKRHMDTLMAQYEMENAARREEQMREKEAREDVYRLKALKLKELGLTSQQAHHAAMLDERKAYHSSKLAQQQELEKKKGQKLQSHDIELLKNMNKDLKVARDMKEDINHIKQILPQVETGTYTQQIAGLKNPYIQGKIQSKGSQELYEQLDKRFNDLVNKAAASTNPRVNAAYTKLIALGKPHIGMKEKSISKIIDSMDGLADMMYEDANTVATNYYEHGISPTNTYNEMSKKHYERMKSEHAEEMEKVNAKRGNVLKTDPLLKQWREERARLD